MANISQNNQIIKYLQETKDFALLKKNQMIIFFLFLSLKGQPNFEKKIKKIVSL